MKLAVTGPAGSHEAYAYTGGKPFDPGLPALVFVHGAMHDHSVWTLFARWFANHGFAVLAPDLPGHGRSSGAPLASVEAIAAWVLALIDAAGASRAGLVGHSMGSLIALEAAAQAPQRADRLVLVGTAFPMTVSPALLQSARDDPFAAIDSVNFLSHSTIAAKPSSPGPGTWLHGASRALMRRLQLGQREANLFLADFEVCDRYRGGLEAAARVACPATLVLGTRDQMTPPAQAAPLAQALRARTVTLPAGHALMSEAPETLLGALRAALGSGAAIGAAVA
ncbi:MAG: alpha/beta hydrolase [Caldimonas sp.]